LTKPVMLDSNVLGRVALPKIKPDIKGWFDALLLSGVQVIIPEISDYEVRRELLRIQSFSSIARLDFLKTSLIYQPISTNTMLSASQLWADARNRGRPTAANNRLDADVILAAQAIESSATIISENTAHLTQFVPTVRWQDYTPTA
jgi:predicted nucleic acid-binding protein